MQEQEGRQIKTQALFGIGYDKFNEYGKVFKRNKYEKNLSQIDIHDVPDIKKLAISELCVFIEEDGTTKIIKSRYDIQGIVISNNQYEDYLRMLKKRKDENN